MKYMITDIVSDSVFYASINIFLGKTGIFETEGTDPKGFHIGRFQLDIPIYLLGMYFKELRFAYSIKVKEIE